MPQFDLSKIYIGEYNRNQQGQVSYTNGMMAAEGISVNLDLRAAEGRLYIRGTLNEYIKKIVGGTISIGAKYIKTQAQKLMFGAVDGSRTISYTAPGSQNPTEVDVPSLKTGSKSKGKYVGVSFYAPDMIDGEEKFSCVFIPRAMFGKPSLTLQTMTESISFQTPTTSGEFLNDSTTDELMIDEATVDSEALAEAWCQACVGGVT